MHRQPFEKSASRDLNRNPARPAFTVIELLVVIGIAVLLLGILTPMILRSWRSANRVRAASDLNAIATALEAYKTDFGDYPRADETVAGGASGSSLNSGAGFIILCRALIGPGPAAITSNNAGLFPNLNPYKAGEVSTAAGTPPSQYAALKDTTNAPPSSDWTPLNSQNYSDGADGPGFKVGPLTVDTSSPPDGVPDVPGGKTYGPYLKPENFKIQGLAILDHFGNPILYFPASPAHMNLNAAGAWYFTSSEGTLTPLISGGGSPTMYNFDDCGTLATSMQPVSSNAPYQALARMQAVLGIRTTSSNTGLATSGAANGRLGATDTPATQAPFLLWSAGQDHFFGPIEDVSAMASDAGGVTAAVNKCDDVVNFSFGQ